jgi:hypothetical protein
MKHIELYENFRRPIKRDGWSILIAFSAGMGSAAAKIFPASEVEHAYHDLLIQRVKLGYKLEDIGPGEEEQQMTREWNPDDPYVMVRFDEDGYVVEGGTLEDAKERAEEIYLPGHSQSAQLDVTDPKYAYAFPVSTEHWTVLDHRYNIFFDDTPKRAFDHTDDADSIAAAEKVLDPKWVSIS